MLQKLKKIVFILSLLASVFIQASASGFSYIYIQGDKQTPFYVKLGGEMQPRYGKNYSVVSRLAPGRLEIEILFQQNEFPAEKFTVIVPENGFRGFMLTKKDGVYALYDLQQSFYLSPGNSADEDVAPVFKNQVASYDPDPEPIRVSKPVASVTTTDSPNPANSTKPAVTRPKNNTVKPIATTPKPKPVIRETPKPVENNEPKFIDNIELNNERTFGTEESATATEEIPATNKPSISNSDCPKPLSFSEYQDVLETARAKTEKSRLKYLLDQTDKCYTTTQVRALTKSLIKDPERYAFLKEILPRITDQSNFSMLESTLQSREWKDYFKLIIP